MREHLILCRREPGPATPIGWIVLRRHCGEEDVMEAGDLLSVAWAELEKQLARPGDTPDVTITNAAREFLTDDPFDTPGVAAHWGQHGAHVVCPEGIDDHAPGNFVGLSSRGRHMSAPFHISTRQHVLQRVQESSPIATPDFLARMRVSEVSELRIRPDLRAVDISEAAQHERDRRTKATRAAAEQIRSAAIDKIDDVKRHGVSSPYWAEFFGHLPAPDWDAIWTRWREEAKAQEADAPDDGIAQARALDLDPEARSARVRESVDRMLANSPARHSDFGQVA